MDPLAVVAAVLRDQAGRILLQRRHHGTHDGGLWEFPGGKVEAGETPLAALARELAEELGIELLEATGPVGVEHRSGDRRIRLDLWTRCDYRGEVRPLEGQPLRWVQPRHLARLDLPEADRVLVSSVPGP